MGDILIIGGGPAGLAAARSLAERRRRLSGRRILLVDAKRTHDILPLLPDVVSKRISCDRAVFDLGPYLEDIGVNFECGEVVRFAPEVREIFLKDGGPLSCEFLILCCGLRGDFSLCPEAARHSLRMDTANDALILASAVSTYPRKKIVVAGAGGWEGVESAAASAVLLRRKGERTCEIHLVAAGEDILPLSWPLWMRDRCRMNLCGLGVNIHVRAAVKNAGEGVLKLTNGMELEDYLLVWCGPAVSPPFVSAAGLKRDGAGRVLVDETLSFGKNCFAAGDAVSFETRLAMPRRGVACAVAEGRTAAENILRVLRGRDPVRYRPRDLGFLLATANGWGCGRILGVPLQGIAAWGLFHLLCAAQMPRPRQKFGVLTEVFLKR